MNRQMRERRAGIATTLFRDFRAFRSPLNSGFRAAEGGFETPERSV
jgi:hypothetical protein